MGGRILNHFEEAAKTSVLGQIEDYIEVGNSKIVKLKNLYQIEQNTEKVIFEINWENIRHYRVVVGQFEKSLAFRTIKVFSVFMFNILIILLDI